MQSTTWSEAGAGRYVTYRYCVSFIILTFYRSTRAHFVPAGQSGLVQGMPYTLLTLLLGWWGIPFGPIFTVMALWANLRGGKQVG